MIKRTTTTEPQDDGTLLAKVRWSFLGIPYFWLRVRVPAAVSADAGTHTTRLGSRKIALDVPVFAGRDFGAYAFKWTAAGWSRWAGIVGANSPRSGAYRAFAAAGLSGQISTTVSLDRSVWFVALNIIGGQPASSANVRQDAKAVDAITAGLA